jgi:hypothetical protein
MLSNQLRGSLWARCAAAQQQRFLSSMSSFNRHHSPVSSAEGMDVHKPSATFLAHESQHGAAMDVLARRSAGVPLAAGSPIFFTDFSEATNYSEALTFVWGNFWESVWSKLGDIENGDYILIYLFSIAFFRLYVHYGICIPVTVREKFLKYGPGWKVGHHIKGHSLVNPLRRVETGKK